MTKTKKVIVIDKEIASIIPSFLENRQNDITTLKENLEQENYASIQTIGHKVSGNAGGYGFHELGQIAKKMERAAKQKNYNLLAKLISDAENYLNRVEIKFE